MNTQQSNHIYFRKWQSGKRRKSGSSFITPYADLIIDWQSFYQDRGTFGIKTDFSMLYIPTRRAGFDRLIIVAQGMLPQRLYEKCRDLLSCWKWISKNLDRFVVSERTAKDDFYAIWVRDSVEPDKELENRSANDLNGASISSITIEERLLYGLKYFTETGKHLDINNITLCSGSRCICGDIPAINYGAGKMNIVGFNADCRDLTLRSRQVVC